MDPSTTVAAPETHTASPTTNSGSDPAASTPPTDLPTVWAPPLSSLIPGVESTLLEAVIAGDLTYNEALDCFLLQGDGGLSRPVVWPAGTTVSSDGRGVTTRSGQTFEVGDSITGGGGYREVGGQWSIPSECGTEIAVFNPSGSVSG